MEAHNHNDDGEHVVHVRPASGLAQVLKLITGILIGVIVATSLVTTIVNDNGDQRTIDRLTQDVLLLREQLMLSEAEDDCAALYEADTIEGRVQIILDMWHLFALLASGAPQDELNAATLEGDERARDLERTLQAQLDYNETDPPPTECPHPDWEHGSPPTLGD